jgi:hypothetical protein
VNTRPTKIALGELRASGVRSPSELHRQVLGFLHPDRAHGDEALRKKLEKCFQEFSKVKFTFADEVDR